MVNAKRLLRYARRSAAMTQRQLGAAAGLPQSTVGRIESGVLQPRWETMARLLGATGFSLEVSPAGGGVDRTQIRRLLRMSPRERLEAAAADAGGLDRMLRAGRAGRAGRRQQ
jgi:transcriptional regulator with XRE-family HTH domain